MTEDGLALYLFEGCVYCEHVRDAARELGVNLEERDIHRDEMHRQALLDARRRTTVPVLRIRSESGDERWLPESADIVRYLYERYGQGKAPPRRFGPYVQMLMWGLLLGGGVLDEPARSALWTLACTVAAARSFVLGFRSRGLHHYAIGGAFAFGALSIALSALDLADLPWWYAAFAVAGLVMLGTLVRRRVPPDPS